MSDVVKYWAVVPAAGVGRRMESNVPKQYLTINGHTVIEHTLRRLGEHPSIAGVVVAIAAGDGYWPELNVETTAPLAVVEGGEERCHSVLNALEQLAEVADPNDWVLVHDAARPCLRADDISRLIDELAGTEGGLLGLPLSDTIKRTDTVNMVEATVDREGLWRALTPQMFRLGALQRALRQAIEKELMVTDDASAMELAGVRPLMVEGHGDNIKITRPQDLALAELYLQQQEQDA